MDALLLLTRAYINMCGYSLGYRTIVYRAGEAWQERLAWQDLPLTEIARKEALVNLMPYITNEYDPEVYDEYDISGMNDNELLDGCEQAIIDKEFEDETLEVLCWGIVKATEKQKELLNDTVFVSPEKWFFKWFGLEFYDVYSMKDPSWIKA